jgi:hypothetical protein
MRCMITLKDGGAIERAMGALAKYRYTAEGESPLKDIQESGAAGFSRSTRQNSRRSMTTSMMMTSLI